MPTYDMTPPTTENAQAMHYLVMDSAEALRKAERHGFWVGSCYAYGTVAIVWVGMWLLGIR